MLNVPLTPTVHPISFVLVSYSPGYAMSAGLLSQMEHGAPQTLSVKTSAAVEDVDLVRTMVTVLETSIVEIC